MGNPAPQRNIAIRPAIRIRNHWNGEKVSALGDAPDLACSGRGRIAARLLRHGLGRGGYHSVRALLSTADRRDHGRYPRRKPSTVRKRSFADLPMDTLPMTRVWLIRHGEPSEDVRHRCYGSRDVRLSEKGRGQMKDVAAYLKSEPIVAVYTSPRSRAQEGAQILAATAADAVIEI